MAEQQTFELRTWGGKRRGAGRPGLRAEAALPHRAREEVRAYQPAHVTLRFAEHVWNLRSERSFAVIHRALEATRQRPDARVVHFSIQGNHVHLIVEADGTRALTNAVRALSIRLAPEPSSHACDSRGGGSTCVAAQEPVTISADSRSRTGAGRNRRRRRRSPRRRRDLERGGSTVRARRLEHRRAGGDGPRCATYAR